MRVLLSAAVFVVLTSCDCGASRLRGIQRDPPLETDAGTTPTADAGTPTLDSGTPMLDAGAPTPDAGTPALDAGTPTFDAGAPTVDAGTPVLDAGTPAFCTPGARRCVTGGSEVCTDDGSAFVTDTSAVGCEFWSLILGWQLFGYFGGNSFAVTVANTGNLGAKVTIEGGTLTSPLQFTVPAHTLVVQPLSDRNPVAPFHVTSTQPVSVVQFNPLHAIVAGTTTHSCDASLLRPTHTWGTEYVVGSWPYYDTAPSLVGLVARADAVVTVTPRATTTTNNLVFQPNVATAFAVDAGTYTELKAANGDLTGTVITSTQPLEVVGGHYGAPIPSNLEATDHLEDNMLPVSTLSNEYFVVSPALPAIPSGKAQIVRIIAAEPNADLTYDPEQPGAPTHLEHQGDFVELDSSAAVYRVRATKKVMVVQYMQGQELGGGMGDPSMFVTPPPNQFGKQYLFHAPVDYDANAVDIVAPTTAKVELDGVEVTGATAIGQTGYSLSRHVSLGQGPTANGNHSVTCSAPCMVSVYGYGQYTSYWYPAGG